MPDLLRGRDCRRCGRQPRSGHTGRASRGVRGDHGFVEALPSTEAYWYDTLNRFKPDEYVYDQPQLRHRDVEHFIWFVSPTECAGPVN